MTENNHRYGEPEDRSPSPQQPDQPGQPGQPDQPPVEHTAVYPGGYPYGAGEYAGPDQPAYQPAYEQGYPPASTVTATPRRPGRTVALLMAAVLFGAAGGVGGAAGFEALTDDSSGTPASSGVTNSTVSDRPDTPAPEGSPEAVAAQVLPSVVKINVVGQGEAGSGSGIILSSDGVILTNDHVVEVIANGGKMSVNFNDGSTATATVIGTDPVTDLAVIKAQGVSGLTPATLGDSNKLDVGEGVVAIGSPYGLQATVTSGIVSALNRPVTVGQNANGTDTTYPAIQTDAAINPGNSGGPLVNLAGEVVGINSSIRTSSGGLGEQGGSIGLGFAIPISKVLPIVQQLRDGETPTHARLGVTVSSASRDNGLVTGATIEEVTPGSAGAKAGLKAGDIVTRVDNDPITSLEGLVATIRGYRPGDKVTLTVLRGGETKTLTATLDSDLPSSQS